MTAKRGMLTCPCGDIHPSLCPSPAPIPGCLDGGGGWVIHWVTGEWSDQLLCSLRDQGLSRLKLRKVPQKLRRVSHPTGTSLLENVEGNSGPFEDDFLPRDNWLKMTLFS